MLIEKIQTLEKLPDHQRFEQIVQWLHEIGCPPKIQQYSTGKNIILSSAKSYKIGIGSHFDTVPNCPGANDNASAIVVCHALAELYKNDPLDNLGVEFFFFDEEERGLVGSHAYLKKFGLNGLRGFLNLELVGMGNQFAIWPVDHNHDGRLLNAFERTCSASGIGYGRYDQVIMNTADHESFRDVGLEDSFTITCISNKDVEVAYHYYRAMEFEVDSKTLYEIIQEAPLFQHYHQPSDKSEHLTEECLSMTVSTIWETLKMLDRRVSV